MNNRKSIGIHFIALDARERAIFDRVIAFNVTHGLLAHTCDDINSSDLVILGQDAYSQVEQISDTKTLLVISNDESCQLGSKQLKRPLLITRVMNKLGDVLKLTQDQNIPESAENNPKPDRNNALKIDKPDSHSSANSHHALVIDDSAAIRKQLELELRDAGITSDFAASGEEALEKTANNQYDLVFLDIIMPGIDGYETCKAMRSTPEYKKTPIIMLSGKTSPLDEVQGVIAGATTYLTKPVKSDKLQETLNRVTKWIDNFAETQNKNTATV
ncbi:MAG: response regulator [Cocleimonas sp.]